MSYWYLISDLRFIDVFIHKNLFASPTSLLEDLLTGVLPDFMKIKRLHPLMRVIRCDMSNYSVVRDPGSWHCCVWADPSAGWHQAGSRWLYIQVGLTSKLLLDQNKLKEIHCMNNRVPLSAENSSDKRQKYFFDDDGKGVGPAPTCEDPHYWFDEDPETFIPEKKTWSCSWTSWRKSWPTWETTRGSWDHQKQEIKTIHWHALLAESLNAGGSGCSSGSLLKSCHCWQQSIKWAAK